MATDEGKMSESEQQEVSLLRGERNQGEPGVDQELQNIPRRRGQETGQQYDPGQDRRERGLLQGELPVGELDNAKQEQEERASNNIPGEDNASEGVVGRVGNKSESSETENLRIQMDSGEGIDNASGRSKEDIENADIQRKNNANESDGKRTRNESENAEDENIQGNDRKRSDGKTDKEKLKQAEKETETNPSEKQIEAGNYKKGRLRLNGMEIVIENPKGSTRSGRDQDGKEWSVKLKNSYGYFSRSLGKDGDQIDVFLGDNLDSDVVYVIDQVDPKTGEFDEVKTMMGFETEQEAREAYLSNYENGWKGLGAITPVSVSEFKKWVGNGTRKQKPFSEYVKVKSDRHNTIKKMSGKITSNWNIPNVTIVEKQSELPKWLRDLAGDSKVEGVYIDPQKGIFIVTENIDGTTPTEIESNLTKTLLHEAVGHFGIRSVFGQIKGYKGLMQKVARDNWDGITGMGLHKSYNQKKEGEEVTDNIENFSEEELYVLGEEYVAHKAETEPEGEVSKSFIKWIMEQLQKLFPNVTFTDNEVSQMINAARDYVKARDNLPGDVNEKTARFKKKNNLTTAESMILDNTLINGGSLYSNGENGIDRLDMFGLDLIPLSELRFKMKNDSWERPNYHSPAFGTVNNRLSKEVEVFERLFGTLGQTQQVPGKLEGSKRPDTRAAIPQELMASLYDIVQTQREYVEKLFDPTVDPKILADEKGIDKKEIKSFIQDVNALRAETDILSNNGKAGRSLDFLLATCHPTAPCSECYAASSYIRMSNVRKHFRTTLEMLMDPKGFGKKVAEEASKISKEQMPFIRLQGSGDLTLDEQVECYNEMSKHADRPIQIFSRHHDMLSRLEGTTTAPFIKMGSLDINLYEIYGFEYLKNNLEERGISNAWLLTSEAEIPAVEKLFKADALGLVLAADPALHAKLPAELQMAGCPCDASERTYYGSCRRCALSNLGCFMAFSDKGVDGNGKIWKITDPDAPSDITPLTAFVEGENLGKAKGNVVVDIMNKNIELIKLYQKQFEKGERKDVPLKDIRFDNGAGNLLITRSSDPKEIEAYVGNLRYIKENAKEGTFILPGGETQKGEVYFAGDKVSGEQAKEVIKSDVEKLGGTEQNVEEMAPRFKKAPTVDSPAFKEWFKKSKVVDENGEPMIVYHGTREDFTEFKQGVKSNTGTDKIRNKAFWFTADKNVAGEFAGRYASQADKRNIMPVYLSLQNPFIVDMKDNMNDVTLDDLYVEAVDKGHDGMIVKNAPDHPYATKVFYLDGEGLDIDARGMFPDAFDSFKNGGMSNEEMLEWLEEAKIGAEDLAKSDKDYQDEADMWGKVYDAWKENPERITEGWAGIIDVYAAFNPNQIKSATENAGTYDQDNADIRFKKSLKDWDYSDVKKAANAIIEEFGTSDSFEDAGYLTVDGELIDFTLQKDGGTPGERAVDHRQVGYFLNEAGIDIDAYTEEYGDYADGMLAFMDMGHIRIMPEAGGVDMMQMPSNEQFKQLRRYAGQLDGKMIIDLEGQEQRGYMEYEEGTPFEVIKRDILNYYQENILPVPSMIRYKKKSPYYSNSEDALGKIQQEKGTPDQWKAMLMKNGSKEAELEWMGWDYFIYNRKSLTKDEIQSWIDVNKVEIEEVFQMDRDHEKRVDNMMKWRDELGERLDDEMTHLIDEMTRNGATGQQAYEATQVLLSMNYNSDKYINATNLIEEKASKEARIKYVQLIYDFNKAEDELANLADSETIFSTDQDTKYSQYTLPGGKNYTELLLTMPVKASEGLPDRFTAQQIGNTGRWIIWDNTTNRQMGTAEFNDREDAVDAAGRQNKKQTKDIYTTRHWDESNILAHVRFNERVDAEGNTVLFIEEIQSDFSQAVRKEKEKLKKMLESDFDGTIQKLIDTGIIEKKC